MGLIGFSLPEDPMTAMPAEQSSGFRLRFGSLEHRTLPNSRFEVRVTLHGRGGQLFKGTAEGTNLAEGRMRAGAEATLEALASYLDGTFTFSFRGARMIRSFDSYIVIVAIRMRSVEETSSTGEKLNLIGCVAIPDRDLAQGAALAVLNASNRILERPIAALPPGGGAGNP